MALFDFWQSHAAELWQLIGQHVALVLASTVAAVVVGVPIGIVAARRPRIGGPLAAAASIVQTIPSLALFGFLLPLPFVGGIGARTALVALILYALLPIIRTTAAGLRSIDPAILEAADAMGMTAMQRLWQVELPLAFPADHCRRARLGGGRRRHRHDRGRDRRGRSRRVHLPRAVDGRCDGDSRRCDSRRGARHHD